MIPENIKNLISALILKTTGKKAIWGKTSRENEFKLHLDNGAITIDQWDDDGKKIDFSIYNKFGDRIEYFQDSRYGPDYELLNKLHTAAKRDFYKADDTIEGIIKEISVNPNIGKRVDESDALPF